MKRIEVTSGQMEEIIRLRERSISWVKIEDAVHVSRRVAQRAYAEWQRQQLSKQLTAVRHSLAEEDMREHRRLLLDIDSQLVSLTEIPEKMGSKIDLFDVGAEDHLSGLWNTDRWLKMDSEGIMAVAYPKSSSEEMRERQVWRRNHMLFESLKEHTRGRVRWRALDEWKAAWDSCRSDFEELEREINLAVRKALADREELKIATGESGFKKVSGELNRVIRQSLVYGLPVPQSIKELLVLQPGATSQKALAGMLKKIAGKTLSGDKAGRIKNNIARARKTALELEESLDPLVLGPLILTTRCDLCPV